MFNDYEYQPQFPGQRTAPDAQMEPAWNRRPIYPQSAGMPLSGDEEARKLHFAREQAMAAQQRPSSNNEYDPPGWMGRAVQSGEDAIYGAARRIGDTVGGASGLWNTSQQEEMRKQAEEAKLRAQWQAARQFLQTPHPNPGMANAGNLPPGGYGPPDPGNGSRWAMGD